MFEQGGVDGASGCTLRRRERSRLFRGYFVEVVIGMAHPHSGQRGERDESFVGALAADAANGDRKNDQRYAMLPQHNVNTITFKKNNSKSPSG